MRADLDRVTANRAVADHLARLDDHDIVALLDAATPGPPGIGGATTTFDIAGTRVFAKAIPLTDRERERDTRNIFDLPTYYQYGIGSAGFGTWREIAVHERTTRWVLDGAFGGFPVVHHWRVLPRPPEPMPAREREFFLGRWGDSPAVRARMAAIDSASAVVVVVMEHIPFTVDEWLKARVADGPRAAAAAVSFVEDGLSTATDFLAAQGIVHFDAHFWNVLTDGHGLYLADFGLALAADFTLTGEERDFLGRHRDYDRCHVATHLTHWLVHHTAGVPWPDCHGYVAAQADAGFPDLPPWAATVATRHAPVATVLGAFHERLIAGDLSAPYPSEALAAALLSGSARGW
ncbi:hypothetical protein [Virgisporangium aurantiacum]|uniref:Protein kinase domain-containing protein n=1 Tax=Virgisporangium aurantiacum TaxID=175570 RepID=A0A8J3Z4B4_9ACTN|nr:hypothetical protein [Virgisporangium aurantiacum]GIJ56522.1 hypothetical protein Vau01_040380 [Virgisporangium aurantiacum]